MDKQILVCKPKTLKASEKKNLADNGFIVIESDDVNSVRIMHATYSIPTNDILCAAVSAIYNGDSSLTQQMFTKYMADIFKYTVKADSNSIAIAEGGE